MVTISCIKKFHDLITGFVKCHFFLFAQNLLPGWASLEAANVSGGVLIPKMLLMVSLHLHWWWEFCRTDRSRQGFSQQGLWMLLEQQPLTVHRKQVPGHGRMTFLMQLHGVSGTGGSCCHGNVISSTSPRRRSPLQHPKVSPCFLLT